MIADCRVRQSRSAAKPKQNHSNIGHLRGSAKQETIGKRAGAHERQEAGSEVRIEERDMDTRRLAWTTGYAGRRVTDLRRLVEHRDLAVVDIRLSARSRVPEWNRGALERLLGDRYRHLPELGNTNYRGDGPVEIADLAAGVRALATLERTPLLLCVCADAASCHRQVVGTRLIELGWNVAEIAWEDAPRPRLVQARLPET
jgi:hypothetical protein